MAELRIDVSDGRSPTVVVLRGDVELSTARRLRDTLAPIGPSADTDVVIDLRDASFLDGMGLGILLGAVNRMSEHGHVVLRWPSSQVRRLIDLQRLAPTVTIEEPPAAEA